MKDENKLGNYHSLNIGDEVLVQCANSYRAVVTDINGNDIGIKVLEEPAKGSRTTAPLFALKKIKSADHNDYCPHGYDSACLICGFGTKDGKRVYHTRPAVVIESTPSPMPNPYWEIAKQALDDVFQANLMRRLSKDCEGLGMPSRLLTTTTGENYTLPYKTQEEWLQALKKAELAINPQLDWPEDWPTNANFYRINVDTPIFYKYHHGQIKRWVKYAKCWVDSCIPDWYAFCTQNAVQALRSWPTYSIAMQHDWLKEYGHRDATDYMTLIHGEWPADGASDAVISPCKQYRYQLRRHGDSNNRKGPALFLMLNPSTADATLDDPTIKRCRSFAESFGYSGLTVVNLYALRSTDPAGLWKHHDPVGPENNKYLRQIAARHSEVICAWGANAKAERVAEVAQIFKKAGCIMLCLGTNKDGSPKHPLYIKSDTQLIQWEKV